MGCTGSRFDEMPVTGHPHGIKVLPGSERLLSMMMMAMMMMMMMMMITQSHLKFKYPHTTNYQKKTLLNSWCSVFRLEELILGT